MVTTADMRCRCMRASVLTGFLVLAGAVAIVRLEGDMLLAPTGEQLRDPKNLGRLPKGMTSGIFLS
jgi:hypothetical protein